MSRIKKIGMLMLNLVIHMNCLLLACKLFSKGIFSMFENFLKGREFDQSFIDLKNASECYVLQ